MGSFRNLFNYIGSIFNYGRTVCLIALLVISSTFITGCSSNSNPPSFTILKENINGTFSSSVHIKLDEVLDKETLEVVSKRIRKKYPKPGILEICFYQSGMDIATSSYWARAYFDPKLSNVEIFGINLENMANIPAAKNKLNELTVDHEIVGTWIDKASSPKIMRISQDPSGQYYFSTVFLNDLSNDSRKTRKEDEKYILMADTSTIKLFGKLQTIDLEEEKSYYKVEADTSLGRYNPENQKVGSWSAL